MSDQRQRRAADLAVQMLDSLPKSADPGRDHALADNVLMTYLRETGSGAVADAYDRARARLPHWFS